MKLVYLANVRLPTEKAHGLQIMEMCRAFNQNGLEVELVVPWRLNYIKNDPFSYYGIESTFKIKRLLCLDLVYLKLFGVVGFWVESITFMLAARIYLWFRHCDILYTREAVVAVFFNKAVMEIHSLPNRLAGFIYRRAQKIIVLTSFLKDRLVKEAGLPESKILVAADGVDIQKFNIKETKEDCRKKLGLPLEKNIVLYAGHLYKWKGADILLEAIVRATNYFVFVGGMKNDLIRFSLLIRQKQLNNVLLVGQRPHAEIPYYLKAADVLVLPNSATEKISSHYTSPMKLFEYMASGTPIVASDLPSIREVLNWQNATLVRPDDPKDLARGIEAVLKNKEWADKIAKKAKIDSVGYDWSKRVKDIKIFFSTYI
ncbi:MAG: Glycosyl transferase group 1 [Candidatus Magasanikbacteria bacterium GW2011_GWA2_41_55]|uniref:Glycosyl transferase group 1 n=1 Tax=Candidatus Magasanikbacteria bacterium GW2011_GWA2_41_55 TaxID=1619038 RepID=A0A0G0YVG6_9BACT|nr:MAG: Glycosyl transferase group 1 [Candidatus Magasanikbacteria bacterium GW2011_GWA2_41_55]